MDDRRLSNKAFADQQNRSLVLITEQPSEFGYFLPAVRGVAEVIREQCAEALPDSIKFSGTVRRIASAEHGEDIYGGRRVDDGDVD